MVISETCFNIYFFPLQNMAKASRNKNKTKHFSVPELPSTFQSLILPVKSKGHCDVYNDAIFKDGVFLEHLRSVGVSWVTRLFPFPHVGGEPQSFCLGKDSIVSPEALAKLCWRSGSCSYCSFCLPGEPRSNPSQHRCRSGDPAPAVHLPKMERKSGG